MKSQPISALEESLGYHFTRPEFLERAVTHSSYAREVESSQDSSGQVGDNEQLEFLGDAVLSLVTSRELFDRFPHFHEGQLSKTRAFLVSEQHLIRAARRLHLGRYLRLSRGEQKSGGREKTTLLVDALEAILAAIYLDAGLEKTRELIVHHILKPELQKLGRNGAESLPVSDFKSALQETAHSLGLPQPSYVLIRERGPEHRKTFTVEARVSHSGEVRFSAQAEGATKKAAEQVAARKALRHLEAQKRQRQSKEV